MFDKRFGIPYRKGTEERGKNAKSNPYDWVLNPYDSVF